MLFIYDLASRAVDRTYAVTLAAMATSHPAIHFG